MLRSMTGYGRGEAKSREYGMLVVEIQGINRKYCDIHVHLPEGAIPKDGPSAGISMATAITSALIKVPVIKSLAMTGEITLRGRILTIGGLKEKILAAHRGGTNKVIIPKQNEKDLHEVPPKILKNISLVYAEHMDEVLVNALLLPNKDEFYEQLKKARLMYQPNNNGMSSIDSIQ